MATAFLHVGAGDQPVGGFQKQFEDFPFGVAKGGLGPGFILKCITVKMRGPATEMRGVAIGFGHCTTAQAGPDTGKNLGGVKGCCDVGIGPEFKACDPVLHLCAA